MKEPLLNIPTTEGGPPKAKAWADLPAKHPPVHSLRQLSGGPKWQRSTAAQLSFQRKKVPKWAGWRGSHGELSVSHALGGSVWGFQFPGAAEERERGKPKELGKGSKRDVEALVCCTVSHMRIFYFC
mmetsp:Transcript_22432/g.48825  ORF Transcript_22432/g.48825 Transcript_22432/m.48825 type:complete len:127 (-) Transcript_22432:169-549(-)